MSQDKQELMEQRQDAQDHADALADTGLNEGFEMEPDDGKGTGQPDGEDASQPVDSSGLAETPPSTEPEQSPAPLPDYAPAEPHAPQAAPEAPASAVPQAEASRVSVPRVSVPEDIADEFERLKSMSPEAAALATEDSPEGELVRARLRDMGADSAWDRADLILGRRQEAVERMAAERQAQEEYNRQFRALITREHPDIMALSAAGHEVEKAQFFLDLRRWIESKPYAEAAPLMRVYDAGNARELSDLFTQFKTARSQAGAGRPDPTAALAVPGRGAPVAPKGIGDKDDFDAGWNLP